MADTRATKSGFAREAFNKVSMAIPANFCGMGRNSIVN